VTINDRDPLTATQIETRLMELPGWETDGARLMRTYQIGYQAAAAMIGHVAEISRVIDHHADIDLRYGTLGFAITTHDRANRITARDFDLARRVEAIAPAHGAR
jgi:4a-hydroxytetrahydrobiopterin dehydratase